MRILISRIVGQTQMITQYFDSTGARLSERVHFLRPTVVYVDLHASDQVGERSASFKQTRRVVLTAAFGG